MKLIQIFVIILEVIDENFEDPSFIPGGTGFLVCLEDFGILFLRFILFFCLFVLLLYVVMAGLSVNLTTLFPGQA